jgi:hypothetical protein
MKALGANPERIYDMPHHTDEEYKRRARRC